MASPGSTAAVNNARSGSTSTAASPVSGPAVNRRGSNSGTLFSGLINQKRNSVDAAAAARRASFNDMKPTPGVLGQMWNKFVSGEGNK